MNGSDSVTLWVEIVPKAWPSWSRLPWVLTAKSVRRTRPSEEDRHRFTEVRIAVDLEARYGPKRVEA